MNTQLKEEERNCISFSLCDGKEKEIVRVAEQTTSCNSRSTHLQTSK